MNWARQDKAPTVCCAAGRGTTPRPTCVAPIATTTRRPTRTTTTGSGVSGGFGRGGAKPTLRAERASSRSRAATHPKAHLPPPVFATPGCGNEHERDVGAGSCKRTSRHPRVRRAEAPGHDSVRQTFLSAFPNLKADRNVCFTLIQRGESAGRLAANLYHQPEGDYPCSRQ